MFSFSRYLRSVLRRPEKPHSTNTSDLIRKQLERNELTFPEEFAAAMARIYGTEKFEGMRDAK